MNELGVDMLRRIGMAMRILDDFLKSEDLDKPSTPAQIMQFLNISVEFKEFAISIMKGEASDEPLTLARTMQLLDISVEFKELAMDISKPRDHALGHGELCVLNTQLQQVPVENSEV